MPERYGTCIAIEQTCICPPNQQSHTKFNRTRISQRAVSHDAPLAFQVDAQTKNSDGALLFAEKMLDIDRVYESAFQLLFEIYLERDDLSALHRLYRAAVEAFKKEFSAPPPQTIQAWKRREPRLK